MHEFHSLATDQVVVSFIIVWLLQALKKASWFPWLTAEKTKLLKIIGVIASGLGAVGIGFHFSADTHELIISGLSFSGVLGGITSWIRSHIFQEGIYGGFQVRDLIVKTLKANDLPRPLRDISMAKGKIGG